MLCNENAMQINIYARALLTLILTWFKIPLLDIYQKLLSITERTNVNDNFNNSAKSYS